MKNHTRQTHLVETTSTFKELLWELLEKYGDYSDDDVVVTQDGDKIIVIDFSDEISEEHIKEIMGYLADLGYEET